MKYVLVNKFDEIVDTVEMPEYNRDARCTDHNDARNYFQGVKRMPDIEEFDKLYFKKSDPNLKTDFSKNLSIGSNLVF